MSLCAAIVDVRHDKPSLCCAGTCLATAELEFLGSQSEGFKVCEDPGDDPAAHNMPV